MLIQEIDSDQKQKNFDKLRELITPNAKVILTCREEYFHTAEEMYQTFKSEEAKNTYQFRFLQNWQT